MAGMTYGAVVAVMGACFFLLAVRVLRERGGRAARHMFRFSIVYLFVLFAALIIEHVSARAFAQGGWSEAGVDPAALTHGP